MCIVTANTNVNAGFYIFSLLWLSQQLDLKIQVRNQRINDTKDILEEKYGWKLTLPDTRTSDSETPCWERQAD